MGKSFVKFMKGMGIGVAVGCAVGAIGNQWMHAGSKGVKKNVNKALKNMSELMEEVSDLF